MGCCVKPYMNESIMLEFIQREFVLNVKFLKIFKKDVRYKLIVSKVF